MSTRSAESTVRLSYTSTVTNTLNDGSTAATVSHAATLLSGKLDSGINSGESDRVWESKSRALADGDTETLDLYTFSGLDIGGGSGRDALGQELTMEELIGIIISVASTSVGRLEVEPGSASGMTWVGSHTDVLGGALPAGGILFKWNPAGNAFNQSAAVKNLTMTARGGAVTYSILLIGRHDDDESSSTSSLSSSSSSSSSRSSLSSTSSLSSQSSHSVTSSSSPSSSSSSISSSSSSSISSSSSSTSSSISSSSSSSASSSSSSSISSSSSSSASSSSS